MQEKNLPREGYSYYVPSYWQHYCRKDMSNIITSCLGDVLYLIIQRWGRANSSHECINTNNGTEALNKALKYTYLPRGQRSINLSKIVTLLVETFLPALRQKYLFANFEQSSVNRRYKDEIPKYLHNKPKAVILHSHCYKGQNKTKWDQNCLRPRYHKRGKKRDDYKYRNRVGKRAEQLRKVHKWYFKLVLLVLSDDTFSTTGS